ncbi:mannosyl-oligosaccharide 1,2-alpha-mannosidase [Coprinopsis marcescibilis]|uniref:alpha-1,2-Mannosidase n=1 Tax=Coprinopsis marcescibilis TaxID=230819 RepID=A0A5C3KVD7_COPMA|nr:mannosyl-oligosaccharide 1,2-alpha-mannosidase [Coprinopsis marcescibilis]
MSSGRKKGSKSQVQKGRQEGPGGSNVSKKETSSVDGHEKEDAGADTKASSAFDSLNSGLLWRALLVAFLAFAYLKPEVLLDVYDMWVGFSEHNNVAHGSSRREELVWLPPDEMKRDAVVQAFKHAWGAYERDAMGSDEYHPISREGTDLAGGGGIGYTVIDAIDTMHIMGLSEEYSRARGWIANNLDFERKGLFSTFETTIRVLGGLLSIHHLSGNDPIYLEKAIDIADRLMYAFEDSPYHLPLPYVDLVDRKGYHTKDYTGLVSVAEVGTLQLELKYLTHLTGNRDYWEAAEKVMKTLNSAKLPHGLASIFLNYEEGQYVTSAVSLGSRGDSFYEYLLKQYIQTNRTEPVYQDSYKETMDGAHQYLIQKSPGNNLVYTSELRPEDNGSGEISWRLTPKQDHLVCFLGGSLLLGATNARSQVDRVSRPPKQEELTEDGWRDWNTGMELIKTCMKTHDTATGLSPEIVYFRVPSDGMDTYEFAPTDWYIRGAQPGIPAPYDARYMLRPETVESLFIAYRLTGDEIFREHGWKIFQAIEKHCKVESGGYATVINVDENPAQLEDKMETFFLSETLKYLYLLFSDSNTIPLDRYVFNTEAHPFPIIQA